MPGTQLAHDVAGHADGEHAVVGAAGARVVPGLALILEQDLHGTHLIGPGGVDGVDTVGGHGDSIEAQTGSYGFIRVQLDHVGPHLGLRSRRDRRRAVDDLAARPRARAVHQLDQALHRGWPNQAGPDHAWWSLPLERRKCAATTTRASAAAARLAVD